MQVLAALDIAISSFGTSGRYIANANQCDHHALAVLELWQIS